MSFSVCQQFAHSLYCQSEDHKDPICGQHSGSSLYSLLHPLIGHGLWDLHHNVERQSFIWYFPPPFPLIVKILPLFPRYGSTFFSEPLLKHWHILILIIWILQMITLLSPTASTCFLFLSKFNASCNSFSSAILGFKLMTFSSHPSWLHWILILSPPPSVHILPILGLAQ